MRTLLALLLATLVIGVGVLAVGAGTAQAAGEDRPTQDRAQFAALLARIKPGMKASAVRALLGAPGDVQTERDPGGINLTEVAEIWRYGTAGHLTCGTLGSVYLTPSGRVKYVYGGRGKPPARALIAEPALRVLMRLLDAVPSYQSGSPDPLALLRAVNALQRAGTDPALAAVAEYLRVTGTMDTPGRDGVFLVLRTLFDAPAGQAFPVMMVGGPSPAAPGAVAVAPRFPLLIVDDIPLLVVFGYALGGRAEEPEEHLAWFRAHGILRAHALAPTATPLVTLDRLAGTPGNAATLRALGLDDDDGRRLILVQGLRLLATVDRATLDPSAPVSRAWLAYRQAHAALKVVWRASLDSYTRPDGSTLPAAPRVIHQRQLWSPRTPRGVEVKLALERTSPTQVEVELRLGVRGARTSGSLVIEDASGARLQQLPVNLDQGAMFQSTTLTLPEGATLHVVYQSGGKLETSPGLTP
jgi:hypothetical protein